MDRLVNYDDLMKGGLFERLDKVTAKHREHIISNVMNFL